MHQPRQIEAVLHQHRLVKAVLLAQLRVAGRIDAAFARHGLDRIAGDQADQYEHEQRDPDEGRNHETQPGKSEPEHAVLCALSLNGKAKKAEQRQSATSTP